MGLVLVCLLFRVVLAVFIYVGPLATSLVVLYNCLDILYLLRFVHVILLFFNKIYASRSREKKNLQTQKSDVLDHVRPMQF